MRESNRSATSALTFSRRLERSDGKSLVMGVRFLPDSKARCDVTRRCSREAPC